MDFKGHDKHEEPTAIKSHHLGLFADCARNPPDAEKPPKENKDQRNDEIKTGNEDQLGPGSELDAIPPDATCDPLPPDASVPGQSK